MICMSPLLHVYLEIGQAVGIALFVVAAFVMCKAAARGLLYLTMIAVAVVFFGLALGVGSFALGDLYVEALKAASSSWEQLKEGGP